MCTPALPSVDTRGSVLVGALFLLCLLSFLLNNAEIYRTREGKEKKTQDKIRVVDRPSFHGADVFGHCGLNTDVHTEGSACCKTERAWSGNCSLLFHSYRCFIL